MQKKAVETPLMKQYYQIKEKHRDAILLFRVGDFYETFSDDAIATSEILGITLTRRANGTAQYVELAGFPHHALDTYLPKLVRAGRRVAICDQLEDPKKTKKLVKRGITELVTPGVVMSDNVLSHKENNYLASVVAFAPHGYGLAFLDISTGEFAAGQGNAAYVDKLLADYRPKELLVERSQRMEIEQNFHPSAFIYEMDDWLFGPDNNRDRLLRHFGVRSLKGFGIEDKLPTIIASGAILNYLDLTNHHKIGHIAILRHVEENAFVRLDRFTVRSLELLQSINEGGCSLLDIIDLTISPMGARLLRKWLVFPLKEVQDIRRRQAIVSSLIESTNNRTEYADLLGQIGDLERLAAKVAMGRISPRELTQVAVALSAIVPIRSLMSASEEEALRSMAEQIDPLDQVRDTIKLTLQADAPTAIGRGAVINAGISAELDELRSISIHGKDILQEICKREQERTGISSLKIAYNNVFGYYIEVRNTHKEKVPTEWIRKQTLVNAERYITDELKEYEEKILGAEERILSLETELFAGLVLSIQSAVNSIQTNASLIARLDVLLALAHVAIRYAYTAPEVNESTAINIKAGRHPVIERRLPPDEPYIPNDIYLDNDHQQIAIITGPNMSGKSALLRQTALITLLAQIGSHVPARTATIGIVDSIFTRVGASDNISLGESTFMVEMQEAANILNNLSDRSLVLFDELGRGTSTYDGISIAWAIIEYLHNCSNGRAKTLFATHYHELGDLEEMLERVHNYNVSAREIDGKMLFLRSLLPGCAEHSFGIQVARLAGIPQSILTRADDILRALESERNPDPVAPIACAKATPNGHKRTGSQSSTQGPANGYQLSFFQLDDPLLSDIRDRLLNVDINRLTPLEALTKLDEVQRLLRGH